MTNSAWCQDDVAYIDQVVCDTQGNFYNTPRELADAQIDDPCIEEAPCNFIDDPCFDCVDPSYDCDNDVDDFDGGDADQIIYVY